MKKKYEPLDIKTPEKLLEELEPLWTEALELRDKTQEHLSRLLEIKQAVRIWKIEREARGEKQ